MQPIRVLIADDHPYIIEGLTSVLARDGVEVVDPVTRADQLLARYASATPDVVVLDVRFGSGRTGLDVGCELLVRYPDARVVFFSQFDQDEIVREAYRLGGVAFVTKDTEPEVLAAAIRKAHAGQRYFPEGIAERLAVLSFQNNDSPQAKLQPRELEVFRMMAQGLTNAEIGERLNLSAKTISTTSQGIKERLGVQRQADLTLLAVKYKVLEP